MNSGAKVEMPLHQWQQLQKNLENLEAELASTKKQLEESRLGDEDSELRAYRDAFEHAMKVVRFGIGNLDPLMVRGWPYASLFALADHLIERPGLTVFEREGAADLKLFAAECKRWEDARARGEERELLAAQNAARGPIVPPQAS